MSHEKEILDMQIYRLVKEFETLQYRKQNIKNLIPNTPIIYKKDLRNISLKGYYRKSTSGSTGEPLNIEKTIEQYIWAIATNFREFIWRKWDLSKNIAVITANIVEEEIVEGNFNKFVFPYEHGKVYMHPTSGNLQEWIDSVPCDYLATYPSIIKSLDTSKFIDIRTMSEQGGTSYSCEEAGTLALQCPDNPDYMHVMENIIMEINDKSEVIITDLCHPFIKRYWLGDIAEFGTCTCNRRMQTIKSNVIGRIRNLALAEDGSRFWPLFGTISFASIAPNMLQYQCVQKTLKDIELRMTGSVTSEEEMKILELMQLRMGDFYNCSLVIVDSFPAGKHEEFISLV